MTARRVPSSLDYLYIDFDSTPPGVNFTLLAGNVYVALSLNESGPTPSDPSWVLADQLGTSWVGVLVGPGSALGQRLGSWHTFVKVGGLTPTLPILAGGVVTFE